MNLFDVVKGVIIYFFKKKWFLFGVLPGVLITGVAVLLLAGHFVMTYQKTCLHCHVTQTRMERWGQWTLPSRVACTECHGETGKILPHKYTASAEFVTKNCEHCHEGMEKKGMHTSAILKFNHKFHIQEMELKCVDCHMTEVHQAMVKGMNRPTHNNCIDCHEEVRKGESESCELCHF